MSTMRTFTGKNFDPIEPSGEIDIEDIAHGLSNLCRFAGQTRCFYSVAQHSVIVSDILEERLYARSMQLQGLLHDATEAYMVDVPRPIKLLPCMQGYREAEENLERYIAEQFGFQSLTPVAVKDADNIALVTEARDLMGNPTDWPVMQRVQPIKREILPLLPEQAKALFLERYNLLTQSGAV